MIMMRMVRRVENLLIYHYSSLKQLGNFAQRGQFLSHSFNMNEGEKAFRIQEELPIEVYFGVITLNA